MTTTRKPTPAPYAVGYGKPPVHTQFRKGQSGNPGGRPRRTAAERAKALALREAYRSVTVREGDKVTALPAIQAVMRAQVALAAKGNGAAQRAIIAAVQAIEQEMVEAAASAAREAAQQAAKGPTDYADAARRIAYILRRAQDEQQQGAPDAAPPASDPGSGPRP